MKAINGAIAAAITLSALALVGVGFGVYGGITIENRLSELEARRSPDSIGDLMVVAMRREAEELSDRVPTATFCVDHRAFGETQTTCDWGFYPGEAAAECYESTAIGLALPECWGVASLLDRLRLP